MDVFLCVFQPTEFEEKAVKKVDDLLESYMGIRDTELGEEIFLWARIHSNRNYKCIVPV